MSVETGLSGDVQARRSGAVGATITGLTPLLALLVVWELLGSADSPFYPAPSAWWPALFVRGQGEDIVPAIIDTGRTFGLGLAAATAVGVLLGVTVGTLDKMDRALGPTFEFLRAVPPAAMVPVATLLLGFDETMKIVVVAIAAIWPILLNTRAGVRQVEPLLLDSARSMHLSGPATLRKVVLPSVLGEVTLGLRVATPIALVITLLVEYLTGVSGLGALIGDAQRTFQPARVYALIVLAACMSLVVNTAVRSVERRVSHRRLGHGPPSGFE